MKARSLFFIVFAAVLLFQTPCFGVMIGTVEEPPGNFKDANGQITGLSVDFVKEIQKKINNNDPIEMLPGARLIHLSLTKKNYVIFSLSRTEERENKYHWIALMMKKPLVLFAKKGSGVNVQTLDDAKKVKSIGVLRRSVQHDFLEENGFTNLDDATDHITNLKKLMAGRITLAYHSMQGMAQLCKENNIDFNQLEPVLMPQKSLSWIAMSKNSDTDVVRQWQKAAADLKADGTFDKLAQKWLAFTEETTGIKCDVKDGALQFWKD